MDALLSSFDFSGIHEKHVDDVIVACKRFREFNMLPTSTPVTISGAIFDDYEKSRFDYVVSCVKNGIDVQAFRVGETSTPLFRFGIVITKLEEELEIWPYMNGHIYPVLAYI